MPSLDAYKCHLNLFCVEIKPKKNANEIYSILQNSSEKIEIEREKKYEKTTDGLNRAEERVGPTSLGFCRTRFWKKNQKLKNEFPKTTCVAFKKKLEKYLNFFQQVNCPKIL